MDNLLRSKLSENPGEKDMLLYMEIEIIICFRRVETVFQISKVQFVSLQFCFVVVSLNLFLCTFFCF